MKKMGIVLLAALTALSIGTAAAEGVKIDGSIKAGETKTILAPYSGVVGDYTAQVGDEASAGDALFTLKAQKVYAEFDGTVTAVFAQGGDNASSVSARYGALAYIEEDVLYRAECSTANSEGGNENKIVHVGETVYIRSTGDSDRVGEARVIGVSGKSYTLEVTKQDDIRIGESIKVYRNDHYSGSSCIGSGKVERVDPLRRDSMSAAAMCCLISCRMRWTIWRAATVMFICRRTAFC